MFRGSYPFDFMTLSVALHALRGKTLWLLNTYSACSNDKKGDGEWPETLEDFAQLYLFYSHDVCPLRGEVGYMFTIPKIHRRLAEAALS